MKKSLLLVSIMIANLMAVEFRIAKGSYEADMSIKSFMKHHTTNDTLLFILAQPHATLSKSPLFYYYDAELLTSESKRQETEFSGFIPSYQFPFLGSVNDMTNDFIDMFPVDGEYKAVGFDMNFGLGYNVVKKGKSYLGLALNLGATLPTINAENLKSKVKLGYELIEKWDLDVSTYKIGPMLKGNLAINPLISLYGSFSLGFQKAAIKSGLFKSSVDVNGDYSALDVGVKYHPKGLWSLPQNLFLTLGYSYKHWSVDSAKVNLYNFFQADVFSPFTTAFSSRYLYMGVGYRF